MSNKAMEYLKNDGNQAKLLRTELMLAPLLVALPVAVSFLFLYHWFENGYSVGNPAFNGELVLAFIILVSNISFDIPFVKTMLRYRKK
ncbi:unnamed protein product [marine sediment metagenome]|uniref:Uncharacterized protein n=1 Tax=marine sediment metagenome TaxID=412755 RepID=X1A5S6_9ZZZZ